MSLFAALTLILSHPQSISVINSLCWHTHQWLQPLKPPFSLATVLFTGILYITPALLGTQYIPGEVRSCKICFSQRWLKGNPLGPEQWRKL